MYYILYRKQPIYSSYVLQWNTVGRERFAGPNVRVFNPFEVFTEIISRCLGQKCSLIKERHLYSRENFCGTLENREKRKCLAQRIFPRLRYYAKAANENTITHILQPCSNKTVICLLSLFHIYPALLCIFYW